MRRNISGFTPALPDFCPVLPLLAASFLLVPAGASASDAETYFSDPPPSQHDADEMRAWDCDHYREFIASLPQDWTDSETSRMHKSILFELMLRCLPEDDGHMRALIARELKLDDPSLNAVLALSAIDADAGREFVPRLVELLKQSNDPVGCDDILAILEKWEYEDATFAAAQFEAFKESKEPRPLQLAVSLADSSLLENILMSIPGDDLQPTPDMAKALIKSAHRIVRPSFNASAELRLRLANNLLTILPEVSESTERTDIHSALLALAFVEGPEIKLESDVYAALAAAPAGISDATVKREMEEALERLEAMKKDYGLE